MEIEELKSVVFMNTVVVAHFIPMMCTSAGQRCTGQDLQITVYGVGR